MEFWAIRHKEFGEFMPARPGGKKAGGWSHWDPLPFHAAHVLRRAPRLFETERAARNALTCWLRGAWVTQYNRGSWEEGYPKEVNGVAPEQPERPRHAEEVEIVQVRLEVRA